jgi:hypothetical protein
VKNIIDWFANARDRQGKKLHSVAILVSFLGELSGLDGIQSCLASEYQDKCRELHEQAAINAPRYILYILYNYIIIFYMQHMMMMMMQHNIDYHYCSIAQTNKKMSGFCAVIQTTGRCWKFEIK